MPEYAVYWKTGSGDASFNCM